MRRLRTSFSLLAVAALAWPASAERFTLAEPMPFPLEGISGVVFPVTVEQAAVTSAR